jgi:hypothetical protein
MTIEENVRHGLRKVRWHPYPGTEKPACYTAIASRTGDDA